jgi:signal transduction histidine kinase
MYSIKRTSPLLRYGFAVGVLGVALGIKLLLEPLIPQDVPFLLLFGAVMVSAWYGGIGPGLLTMILAGLATNFLFLRPQDPFGPETVSLLVFFLEGTLVCLLTEALRAARARAEASKAEAEREHERLRRSEEHFFTEQKEAEGALKRSLGVQLALYETGRILGSSLEWEEIGSRLLEVVRRVSNLTAVVISVPDEDGKLSIWRSSGLEGLWHQARFAPEALSARRKVLERRERQLLRLRRPDAPQEHLVGLYLPLLVQDRSIGVLEAYGPDTLVDEGAETLSSLASQAASALENARLYTELSERENRLRDLVGRLIRAQEEERRRVAYDVHDGLAQTAAAAHQHLQAFARHHPPCSAEDQEELDEALELVRELVGEARQVIYDLRPTVLDDFGLAAAVRLQVATLRADGLRIDLEESLGDGRLPQEVETTLFRVIQEALTNIRKHAEATRVRIVLDRPKNAVRLLVEDEGRGFVPKGATGRNGRGEKVGLSGMRERVSLLGGRFELHSEPGAGTTIEAEVELPQTGEDPS